MVITELEGGVVDVRGSRAPARWRAWHGFGRAGLAAVVAVGLLGLLGPGPLNGAEVTSDRGVHVRFARFVRANATTAWEVHLPAGEAPTLRLDEASGKGMQVVSVWPAPADEALDPGGVTWRFRAAREGGVVRLQLRPRACGWWHPRVAVGAGAPVTLDQFVWP